MSKKIPCFLLVFACSTLVVTPSSANGLKLSAATMIAGMAGILAGAITWGTSQIDNKKQNCDTEGKLFCCNISTPLNETCQQFGHSINACNPPAYKTFCINQAGNKTEPEVMIKPNKKAQEITGIVITFAGIASLTFGVLHCCCLMHIFCH